MVNFILMGTHALFAKLILEKILIPTLACMFFLSIYLSITQSTSAEELRLAEETAETEMNDVKRDRDREAAEAVVLRERVGKLLEEGEARAVEVLRQAAQVAEMERGAITLEGDVEAGRVLLQSAREEARSQESVLASLRSRLEAEATAARSAMTAAAAMTEGKGAAEADAERCRAMMAAGEQQLAVAAARCMSLEQQRLEALRSATEVRVELRKTVAALSREASARKTAGDALKEHKAYATGEDAKLRSAIRDLRLALESQEAGMARVRQAEAEASASAMGLRRAKEALEVQVHALGEEVAQGHAQTTALVEELEVASTSASAQAAMARTESERAMGMEAEVEASCAQLAEARRAFEGRIRVHLDEVNTLKETHLRALSQLQEESSTKLEGAERQRRDMAETAAGARARMEEAEEARIVSEKTSLDATVRYDATLDDLRSSFEERDDIAATAIGVLKQRCNAAHAETAAARAELAKVVEALSAEVSAARTAKQEAMEAVHRQGVHSDGLEQIVEAQRGDLRRLRRTVSRDHGGGGGRGGGGGEGGGGGTDWVSLTPRDGRVGNGGKGHGERKESMGTMGTHYNPPPYGGEGAGGQRGRRRHGKKGADMSVAEVMAGQTQGQGQGQDQGHTEAGHRSRSSPPPQSSHSRQRARGRQGPVSQEMATGVAMRRRKGEEDRHVRSPGRRDKSKGRDRDGRRSSKAGMGPALQRVRWQILAAIRHRRRHFGSLLDGELASSFATLDRDGSGVLELNEFTEALKHLDVTVGGDVLDALWRAADKDGSGAIDYQEFMNWLGLQQEEGAGIGAGEGDDKMEAAGGVVSAVVSRRGRTDEGREGEDCRRCVSLQREREELKGVVVRLASELETATGRTGEAKEKEKTRSEEREKEREKNREASMELVVLQRSRDLLYVEVESLQDRMVEVSR